MPGRRHRIAGAWRRARSRTRSHASRFLHRSYDYALVILALGFLLAFPLRPGPLIELDAVGRWFGRVFHLASTSPPERFLDAVRDRPPLLRGFLQQFPKGADLHVHLSGAVYLERLLDWAKAGSNYGNLCIVAGPVRIAKCRSSPPSEFELPLSEVVSGSIAPSRQVPAELQGIFPIQRLIDSLSMRHFVPGQDSGADQFFDAFSEISPLLDATPQMIKEVQDAHNSQGLQYIEVMISLQDLYADDELKTAGRFKDRVSQKLASDAAVTQWPANAEVGATDLTAFDQKLGGYARERAAEVARHLDNVPLGDCSLTACSVEVRLVQQLNRTAGPGEFYAQLLFARELLRAEQENGKRRVVGLNIVSPEHAPAARAGARAQMAMIKSACGDRSSPCYGRVAIHAGELVVGLAPPGDLDWHIGAALDIGAKRIGHAVAIGHEATRERDKPFGLFDELLRQHTAIEINLTSNRQILGVQGRDHPLPDYLAFGIPVVISTDDEGLSRSDVTNEWVQAVRNQGLGYRDLVQMARNSIEYSFLDGESLWDARSLTDTKREYRRGVACFDDRPEAGEDALSEPCRKLLNASARARHEWIFEQRLAHFAGLDWDGLRHRLSGRYVSR